MNNVQIFAVVRFYKEDGDYSELRYDNVSCENLPEDDLEYLISGEVICVELTPNAKMFYFAKPNDWPENWTEIGTHIAK